MQLKKSNLVMMLFNNNFLLPFSWSRNCRSEGFWFSRCSLATGPAREPVPARGEAGAREGVAGCRGRPSAACRASAARANTATVGDAAAFDAGAYAASAACAAFAFAAVAAAAAASVDADVACGAAEAAAAGDAGNAAAAFAAESAGGAFAAAAIDGAASAAASAAAASAAAWKCAGIASVDSVVTTRLTADHPLPSAPAAVTERRRASCSDELP